MEKVDQSLENTPHDLYYEIQPCETKKMQVESGNLLLKGKRAVIFAASGGVGGGVAKIFAAQGAEVFSKL